MVSVRVFRSSVGRDCNVCTREMRVGRIVRVGERVGERTADPHNGFELNIKVSEFRKFNTDAER